jgi:hypothetical protein
MTTQNTSKNWRRRELKAPKLEKSSLQHTKIKGLNSPDNHWTLGFQCSCDFTVINFFTMQTVLTFEILKTPNAVMMHSLPSESKIRI